MQTEAGRFPEVDGFTIWDNYSRDIMASSLFRSQDVTAYLIVLHEALVRFGVPEMLVSDSGGIFLAKHAQQIYQTVVEPHQHRMVPGAVCRGSSLPSAETRWCGVAPIAVG